MQHALEQRVMACEVHARPNVVCEARAGALVRKPREGKRGGKRGWQKTISTTHLDNMRQTTAASGVMQARHGASPYTTT